MARGCVCNTGLIGVALACGLWVQSGCQMSESEGVARSAPARTTVKMDFFHKPLPEIPLPNDVATIVDPSSPTGRRINASMVAPTEFERLTRRKIDELDGWGVFQPITIPFTGPLDIDSIIAGHRDPLYETENDVVYLIDIDPASPEFGKLHYLDVGNGNYPVVLEKRDNYWANDPRASTISILFEEVDEDTNGNGRLDPGEDTDADGVLDKPNYYPGAHPAPDDLAGRADALMTFYERETNTLILRPLVPLRERTTYAVVVTRRIKDIHGDPVGSPYPAIHHSAQTEALRPLARVLPHGLTLDDVAFAFTFTTQSVQSSWRAVREGLYGYGPQRHLAHEFPARVEELLPLRDPQFFRGSRRLHLLYGEQWLQAARPLATTFLGLDPNSEEYRRLAESLQYVDYFVIGTYRSPQLFPRTDAAGNFLPLNEQVWPEDLDQRPAPARSETIYFTLAVPRKEVSARGEGRPAPVALLSHGYTGNRFPIMQFAGFFARHGLATIAIDGPSHGIGLTPEQESLARALLRSRGLEPAVDATLSDRAFDQNGDGIKDSGADFWSAYLFHTRDIVRQFMLDYSQLVRILRSFDGRRYWDFDLGEDGVPDLAGDFDGDGKIDVGGSAPIVMTGASLGGIMSMLMGGAEPEITAVAPIAGGGGYVDIGMRTVQGGALEAFVLRVMGPLYVGTLDAASGRMRIETVVVDLNDDATRLLGTVAGIEVGDTMVVENLRNGVRGCGLTLPGGRVRASLQSDRGDPIRILFYAGPVLVPGSECAVQPGAQLKARLEEFQADFVYQGTTFRAGEPLRALEDGLGRARNTPEIRRLSAIGQLVVDPADPAVFARHLLLEPLEFPFTGKRTGSHALVITSQGDMNVPASSGVTFARAAGLVPFLEVDPRYGRSPNQVLIDTYTVEAVDNLRRHTDAQGRGVHMDVENFSGGEDIWGPSYPRLDPPLRLGFDRWDPLGGRSAAIFPLTRDTGEHGFSLPGAMIDDFRAKCRAACPLPGSGDPCNCRTQTTYDIGSFLINMLARFLASNGAELSADLCQSRNDCPGYLPPPRARSAEELL